MRIILDSNILFSALIKNSFTRKKLLEYQGHFLFPEIIFQEIEKHKEELRKKSSTPPEEFYALLELLLKKVEIVPTSQIVQLKGRALEIIENIDRDDVLFIACALAFPNSVIWSDDKRLKLQKAVKVYSSQEISSMF